MYKAEYIKDQIRSLEIPDGAIVLMHTSLRSVGKLNGGAEKLLDLLIEDITLRGGLLCVPTHTWSNLGTDNITLDLTKCETNLGAFPTVALCDSRGIRSLNPTHSVVVFGDRERINELISDDEFVKTPTSPESAYGKLYALGGYVLLVGVGQNSNTYLHSVEEMLDLPNRVEKSVTKVSVKYKDGSLRFSELYMFDESVHGDVSHKFYMYEPAFRAHGAIRDGMIGDAPVQLCDARIMKECIELMASRAPGRDPLLYANEIPREIYI